MVRIADPKIIPDKDLTGNQDSVADFKATPYPEPKGFVEAEPAAMVLPPNVPLQGLQPGIPVPPQPLYNAAQQPPIQPVSIHSEFILNT